MADLITYHYTLDQWHVREDRSSVESYEGEHNTRRLRIFVKKFDPTCSYSIDLAFGLHKPNLPFAISHFGDEAYLDFNITNAMTKVGDIRFQIVGRWGGGEIIKSNICKFHIRDSINGGEGDIPIDQLGEWTEHLVGVMEKVGTETEALINRVSDETIKWMENANTEAIENVKQYSDEKDDEVREYVDTQDLEFSKINKQYADSGDESALRAAKNYADEGDRVTLNAAKNHAELQDEDVLRDSKAYTDEKAESVLQDAKAYSDSKISSGVDSVKTLLNEGLAGKADKGSSYTKQESDSKYLTTHQSLDHLVPKDWWELKADATDVYTRTETDSKLAAKADKSSVYTKTESDGRYLQEHQDISGKADKGESYTKAESDGKYLTEHQSLDGYYVKEEVDTLVESEVASKLDKPVGTPNVGDLMRIKQVNDDGTYTFELVPSNEYAKADDLNWERERVDDAYDILDGVGYDKVELTGEAYSVDIPEKTVGKAEITEIGGKTIPWNSMVRESDIVGYAGLGITLDVANYSGHAYGTPTRSVDYNLLSITSRMKTGNVYLFTADVNFYIYYFSVTISTKSKTPSACIVQIDAISNPTYGLYLQKRLTAGTEYDFSWTPHCIDLTKLFGVGNEPTSTDDPRIKWIEQYAAEHPEYNEGELISAMIDEITSVRPDETIIESHQIPEAVKSLPGYGWSAGTAKNYIYRYNGRWMYRQEVNSVDLGTLGWSYINQDKFACAVPGLRPRNYGSRPNLLVQAVFSIELTGYNETYDVERFDNIIFQYVGVNGLRSKFTSANGSVSTFKTAISGVMLNYELETPIITDITDLIPLHFGELDVEAGGSVAFENDALLDVPYKMDILEKRVTNDVFWCEYGVTTYNEITDALNAGKLPCLYYSSRLLVFNVVYASDFYRFVTSDPGRVFGVRVSPNSTWDAFSVDYLQDTTLSRQAIVKTGLTNGGDWTAEQQLAARELIGLEKEWTLVGTIHCDENDRGNVDTMLRVDLTGYTELLVKAKVTATGTTSFTNGAFVMASDVGFNGKRMSELHFVDGFDGYRPVRARYVNSTGGFTNLYYSGGLNTYEPNNNMFISKIRNVYLDNPSRITFCDVQIYAR